MKKTWAVMGTAVAVSAMIFTGCGSSNTTTGTDTTQESENTDTAATDTPAAEDSKGGDFSGLISPISREEGSGTRGAFIELFGIETKDTDGNKIDNTTDTAEITNSTSVMMTTVAGNEYAIGYVSLGSLDDSVKALKIDGAEASVDTVKDGSYKISRSVPASGSLPSQSGRCSRPLHQSEVPLPASSVPSPQVLPFGLRYETTPPVPADKTFLLPAVL